MPHRPPSSLCIFFLPFLKSFSVSFDLLSKFLLGSIKTGSCFETCILTEVGSLKLNVVIHLQDIAECGNLWSHQHFCRKYIQRHSLLPSPLMKGGKVPELTFSFCRFLKIIFCSVFNSSVLIKNIVFNKLCHYYYRHFCHNHYCH